MLEILFLMWFSRRLAALARSKGRSGGWGGLGVALWLGGEIGGFCVGLVAGAGEGAAYLLALLLAAIGALAAYGIVRSLGDTRMSLPQPIASGAAQPAAPADLANPYAPPRS
jgi:hypothetical protein